VLHERIITTLPKAKELRPFAEKAVTLGRRTPQLATRQAAAFFFSGNAGPESKKHKPNTEATAGVAALKKLTGELAGRFADRPGGYTRIFKLGPRKGDGAEMALIEFVGSEDKKAVEDKEEKSGKKK
jgi:large subunit ribosomal protein L17